MYIIIMLWTLNLRNVTCQLYLSKARAGEGIRNPLVFIICVLVHTRGPKVIYPVLQVDVLILNPSQWI